MTKKELAEIIVDYKNCQPYGCDVCKVELERLALPNGSLMTCTGVLCKLAIELAELTLEGG